MSPTPRSTQQGVPAGHAVSRVTIVPSKTHGARARRWSPCLPGEGSVQAGNGVVLLGPGGNHAAVPGRPGKAAGIAPATAIHHDPSMRHETVARPDTVGIDDHRVGIHLVWG